jgi:D-threo-aldose 1-dehydrogenase
VERLSTAGLGTAGIGGLFARVDDNAAHAVVERAWEHGIRVFDTAPLYGFGLSERRLGRVLATRARADFRLSTKVGRLLRANAPPDPSQAFWKGDPRVAPVFDFSYDGTLRSLDESLERLGLDRIDTVFIHDPDDHERQALDHAYRALDRLRAEGVIHRVGVGMNQVEMLVRFAREARFDCFLVAGRYTMLDQAALPELLPLCEKRGIRVMVGGALNSGILARPDPGAMYDYRPASPELLERARRIDAVCARHDVPLLAAALQFPRSHPAVECVLVGPRSVAELDLSVEMLARPIPGDLWDVLKNERLLLPDAPTP